MDQSPPLRMKVLLQIVLLLTSSSIVWLQEDTIPGANHHLQCVNDYKSIMNCSLDIMPSNDSVSNKSYWLKVEENIFEVYLICPLTRNTEGYFCSIKASDVSDEYDLFLDVYTYEISLCQSQNRSSEICEVIDEEYEPQLNIKPTAPCCLTVTNSSSQQHFSWKSTYEEESGYTGLPEDLRYELHLYRTEEKHGKVIQINTDTTNYSMNNEKLELDADYAARVRSTPNMGHYKGQWSDWSSEVLWRTDSASAVVRSDFQRSALTFQLCLGFVALCVMVFIVSLLLYYCPVKTWRQRTFIPTPAPYFSSLYSNYQGDFRSWVVIQENTTEVLKAEETLQIDTLIKVVQDDKRPPVLQKQLMEGSGYSNVPGSDCDTDLSILCTDSSTGWLSAQGSSNKTLPVWYEPGSPAQDSGCWLCSDTSLEKEPPWYCNEYCTLSCIQESGCVTAEHHGNPAHHRLSA